MRMVHDVQRSSTAGQLQSCVFVCTGHSNNMVIDALYKTENIKSCRDTQPLEDAT